LPWNYFGVFDEVNSFFIKNFNLLFYFRNQSYRRLLVESKSSNIFIKKTINNNKLNKEENKNNKKDKNNDKENKIISYINNKQNHNQNI